MAASLAIGTGAAYLKDEAVDELFGGGRFPVIAGQGTRAGHRRAAATAGFALSGSWSFASGIKHSTHIHTLGVIEGTGEPRIFVLPVEQATLIDNWDVLGLRGTGSIDYRIDDVFVPEAYTHFAVTDEPKRGGELYHARHHRLCHHLPLRAGRAASADACSTRWRRRSRSGIGRSGTQAGSEAFHEQYAKAEGDLPVGARARLRDLGRRESRRSTAASGSACGSRR